MKKFLRKIYGNLPVIRELRRFEEAVAELLSRLDAASLIQTFEALKAGNERYRDPRRLLIHGAQYWSQNYEDGMIAEVFRRVGVTSKTFLEIGIGDGKQNNTAALLAMGWSGFWVEGDGAACEEIMARLKEAPAAAARLKVRHAFVSPENIAALLAELEVPQEVDLFSLDIDMDTYHVWEALKTFKPRVVVVEYNAAFPADVVWIHPFEPGRLWNGTQNFGASLKAFEKLGASRGYSLVGCDIIGCNAFFVRNDLAVEKFAAPFTAENHHEPPRYQLVHRSLHRAALPFIPSAKID